MTDRADAEAPEPRGGKTGSQQLLRLRERLSARDLRMVELVSEHRFISTTQLQRLCFADHATPSAGVRACNRVLERLLRLRVLSRIERQIGGVNKGSAAHTWCLDILGDRLSRDPDQPRRRFYHPGQGYLHHCLAVAEARVVVEEAARTGTIELLHVAVEQIADRRHLPGAHSRYLRPDLTLHLGVGDYEDHWQVEIDLGTESLRTLLAKCDHYARWAASLPPDTIPPRVLWQLPTTERLQRLRSEIARATNLDRAQFVLTTPGELISALTNTDVSDPQKGGIP